MNKEYENVVNQYIQILLYDIDIKLYELKINKYNIDAADDIFDKYYDNKLSEFNKNIRKAKEIYK